MKDIANYIEPLYSESSWHSSLGNLSPAEYELKYQQKQQQNLLASVADYLTITNCFIKPKSITGQWV